MADKIIVGSKECTIQNIVNALQEDEVIFAEVVARWGDVADGLSVPGNEKAKLLQDTLLNKVTDRGVVTAILQKWKLRKSTAATLEQLCIEFDKKGLNDASTLLKNKFVKTGDQKKNENRQSKAEEQHGHLNTTVDTVTDEDIVDGSQEDEMEVGQIPEMNTEDPSTFQVTTSMYMQMNPKKKKNFLVRNGNVNHPTNNQPNDFGRKTTPQVGIASQVPVENPSLKDGRKDEPVNAVPVQAVMPIQRSSNESESQAQLPQRQHQEGTSATASAFVQIESLSELC